jgi:CHAD domain-containing protein
VIELSPSLLSRSPEETARHLALGILDEADSALARLERGEDQEALHDFRVALRRLRSAMRAYRPYLKGSAKKKLRARLEDLADSTNAARDLEVQIEWLEKCDENNPEAKAGALRLLEQLRSRRGETPGAVSLRREFDPLHQALRKSLSRSRLRLKDDTTFLAATGELAAEKASRLKESLEAVSAAEAGAELHRARIAAKRLRYLLEPISAEYREARALVRSMKSLQDVLGELQDTRVLSESIASELERDAVAEAQRLRDLALREAEVPASIAPADPGLLVLLRAQRERRDREYLALSRSWLSGKGDAFFERAQKLAHSLKASAKPPRRFLLSEVPERAKRRARKTVRQAFLPGRRIHELVESVESGGRIRYLRIARSPGARTEERISKETFERFWAIAPHRLERSRYIVRENGRTFSIDEFPDANVILVEPEDGAELPKWLASVVEKEVTGSRKYEGEVLSSRSRSAPETPGGPRAGAQ